MTKLNKRKKQKAWRREYVSRVRVFSDGRCLNCGEPGPHFVPPGFGTIGFYVCEKRRA